MDGFRMQCVEDAVITSMKENSTKNKQGQDVTYYSVTIAALGKAIEFACNKDDFSKLSEGDHVNFTVDIFGSGFNDRTWRAKNIIQAKAKSKE